MNLQNIIHETIPPSKAYLGGFIQKLLLQKNCKHIEKKHNTGIAMLLEENIAAPLAPHLVSEAGRGQN